MKLESLSLAHCGGFKQLGIAFEPDVTLIAGVNGVGKSTIPHVLTVLRLRALPAFTPSRSASLYFTDDDIEADTGCLTVSARTLVDGRAIDARAQRLRATDEKGDHVMRLRQSEIASSATNLAQVVVHWLQKRQARAAA